MSKRIAAVLMVAFVGCIKEITSEERLDRETKRTNSLSSSTAGDLLKSRCDDIATELIKARDANTTEEKRINIYGDLFDRVKERTVQFDEALARNPDLEFQEGSREIIGARDGCVQAAADVRLDFEVLVRDIVNIPVVEEIRDGRAVKAPRLSFESLREAIEKLDPDDKESLVVRLSNAEKTVDTKEPRRGKREK
jgi:hypothetical protein